MKIPEKKILALLSCGIITISLTGKTTAASLELSKFVEIGVITTNNLTLASEAAGRVNDEILNITPSVELKLTGNRFGLLALGQLEYYRYNSTDEYILDPSLFLRGRGTLIDDFLFLDSSLEITQAGADNTFLRTIDDDATAVSSKTSATVDHSIGQLADLYASYTFKKFVEEMDEDAETDSHSLELKLQRSPIIDGFLWGLGGTYSQSESNRNTFKDSNIYGNLGTLIQRDFLTEVTYGVENYELIQTTRNEDPEAVLIEDKAFWNVQLTWTPSKLTKVSVGYDDRYYAAGPNLTFNKRMQNSIITASYFRTVDRQAAALNRINPLTDNTDQTFNNTDAIELNNTNNLTPLDQPYANEQLHLGYKIAGRQSDVFADLVYSDQEALDKSDKIKTLLARVAFDRKLNDFFSVNLQYDYQTSESNNRPNRNFNENRLAIKFKYSFDGNDRN